MSSYPLADNVYTPTLTNVANISASTAYPTQYLRVGNSVFVSGQVDFTTVLGGQPTNLGISLPFASDFAQVYQCAGTAFTAAPTKEGAVVRGDITNNRAEIQYEDTNAGTHTMCFQFMYRII